MKKIKLIIVILLCLLALGAGIAILIKYIQPGTENPLEGQEHTDKTSHLKDPEVTNTPEVPTPTQVEPSKAPIPEVIVTATPIPVEPIVLAFGGDVNLDENSRPVAKYDLVGKDITKCLSSDLIEAMKAADIMMINNEFAYSTRGTKQDKSYTFRAHPDRVDILKELGVDIVSLANNHALDFGPDALLDTFDTLENAEIDYIGAGRNLDRAKAPIYYEIGDKKIAYIAASRVVFAMDWYASKDGLGMVGTYDPTLILESVREAEKNSDFVVIYLHWGVERVHYPVDYQRTLAKQYIDAGADAVIGCHPHVMQGFEYYNGKPIAYSLGNYWFNRNTDKSGLLKLYLNEDDTVQVQINPTATKDTFSYFITDEAEKKSYLDFMNEISYNVKIDDNGFVTPTE